MAMTQQQIEAEITKIDTALNSGATNVAYLGRSVTRSMEALRQRKAELQAMLTSGTPMVRHIRTYSPGDKGL